MDAGEQEEEWNVDKTTILEQFGFYRDTTPAWQREIAEAASYATLPKGACFYREGDEVAQFALVGAGSIRVFKVGETGREITLYHVQDGQTCLINMLCVFLGKPAMATAAVETPVEAVIIPAAAFRDWVRTRDSVRHFIFETMAERMVAVMTLVEEVAFRRMDTRLAAALLNRFEQAQPANFISTTHEEIAAELGTAREVVSRLLKELERQGAVHLARGRVELHDAALLRRLAEET